MIKRDYESKQEINTETYLKKKKIKKRICEEQISQYVQRKEAKTKRIPKNLSKKLS